MILIFYSIDKLTDQAITLIVLLISPLNTMNMFLQSKVKVKSHTSPPIVRFHSMITK